MRQTWELRTFLTPWSITQAPVPKEEAALHWRHLHFWGAERGIGFFSRGICILGSHFAPFASQVRDFASLGLSGYVRQALIVFLRSPHVR